MSTPIRPLRRTAAGGAVLLSLCALSLTACGDDGDTSATDDTTPSASATSPSASDTGAAASGTTCDYVAGGDAARKVDLPPSTPDVSGQVPATIATNIGDLEVTLDADATPCTVNSFVSLAKQGYFDKTTCHRLTTAPSGIYVLQCGDPLGTGYGGPGYTIPDEFTGEETYGPGVLAMANTGAPNSGGSQFFIVYQDSPLPPQYTVFGTLDKASLAAVTKDAEAGADNSNGPGDGKPVKGVDITSVTVG
ncbi:hypothetical protein GCM10022215_36210 [Nocardioides fonticola]|uniref:PPIase cyclophilin-type domain-containing protein n=1 Tax=Nocardioides fonticola TaxID=450363 RepID=A0ABP7XV56_9ACTN